MNIDYSQYDNSIKEFKTKRNICPEPDNYEKLKTICHQNFIGSEKCGECGGEDIAELIGLVEGEDLYCSTCKGKGYTIPLSFGCEGINRQKSDCIYSKVTMHSIGYVYTIDLIEDSGQFWEQGKCTLDKFENLGKPLTHVDVFRLLKMTGDTRYESTILIGDKLRISRPTNKTETHIEEGVGINNEQYGVVTNDVWLDITIDLDKDIKDQPEVLQAIIDIVK